MAKLNKFQQNCVDVLRARLNPAHPGFRGSVEVRAALEGPAGLYFYSWVRPLVEAIEHGPEWHGMERSVAQDAALARRALDQWSRYVKAAGALDKSNPNVL